MDRLDDKICYMGLSLGKPLFHNKKIMKKYASYMSENFYSGKFIIVDKPKRYNLIYLGGYSNAIALKKINDESDNMRNFLIKIVRDYQNLRILSFKDYVDDKYDFNLEKLFFYYNNNEQFNEDVNMFIEKFLLNQTCFNISDSDLCGLVTNLSRYTLEELALFVKLPLNFDRKCVEIYPGEQIIQQKLIDGKYGFERELFIGENIELMNLVLN